MVQGRCARNRSHTWGSAKVLIWTKICTAAVVVAGATMVAGDVRAASQESMARRNSAKSAVISEIDALEKEITDLEARAESLLKDNKDLTARFRRRAGDGSVQPAPASVGEAAMLVTTPTNEVEDRVVLVWSMSGGLMAGAKVVAKMRSGFPVRILAEERSGGQDWVQCYTYHFTRDSLGWVVAHAVRRDRDENRSQNGR